MHINNFWTPKPKYDNDINIMDKAQEDVVVKASQWPLLYHINMCRLYVRAFTIGDLTKDGINIYLPYLEGTEIGINQEISILAMRRPTGNQWRVWKSFIFRTFLSPSIRINPSLGKKLDQGQDKTLKIPNSEIDDMLTIDHEDYGMKALMKKIPEPLLCMVGEIDIPLDEGLSMSEAIVDGRCIGASDGSLHRTFQEQKGSHGYALREKERVKEDILGHGPSPSSDDMSSMTT